MYTIKSNIENTIIIKNSKFITLLIPIEDLSSINNLIATVKLNYPKATHYCYAYIIDNLKHTSDDNEPSGTAGLPLLNVLEKHNLTNILCIVVRYFGGIKLGRNGLVRAYTKSLTECLNKATILKLVTGYEISLTIPYSKQKDLDYLLKDYKVTKSYQNDISYHFYLPKDKINILTNYPYHIIKETTIKEV
jgi:uncharacterized YigZ family protein